MKPSRRLFSLTLAAVLAGSFGLATAVRPPAARAAGNTPVSIRFSWKLKGEYAPLYVALDKGYFAAEGLDVTLGEGAGSQSALASLIKGDDQAVWLPGVFAIQAITTGLPIKMVALYNQAAPIEILSWPNNPIRTPKDLEGKTIAGAVGETGTTFLPVLCERNHVDCSKVHLINMNSDARVPAFIAKKVDAVTAYLSNDMPILDAKYGRTAFVKLDESKVGAGVPGSALVASDDYISKHPDVLAKLIRAINRGIDESARDPQAAAGIMLKHWPGTSLTQDVVADQVRGFLAGMTPTKGKPMGYIPQVVVENAMGALKSADQIKQIQPATTVFTNDVVMLASKRT